MKRQELKRKLEECGYYYDHLINDEFQIRAQDGEHLLTINEDFARDITTHKEFHNLPLEEQIILYNWSINYAITPIEEREELKKYRYRTPEGFEDRFITLADSDGEFFFSDRRDEASKGYKKAFTDAEVASYPEDIQKIFQACIKEEVR